MNAIASMVKCRDFVPILTQSENWALCWLSEVEALFFSWFQSSPSPKTGRYVIAQFHLGEYCVFQSSPSPKTGRYINIANSLVAFIKFQSSPSPKTGRYVTVDGSSTVAPIVPILTQSENWALCPAKERKQVLQFQSSPSPKTGRYAKLCHTTMPDGSNPHPVRKLGAIFDIAFTLPIL